MTSLPPILKASPMTDLERLSAELEALKQRVALLEANASQKPKMVYNWHLTEPKTPDLAALGQKTLECRYEHYIDPAMRLTRNGN